MAVSLLDLPAEIRLDIYDYLIPYSVVIVQAGAQEQKPSFLSGKTKVKSSVQVSGQILRVCRIMREEALPVLYGRTQFCVVTQAFAGQLPSSFSKDVPFAANIRHLVWQLSCDMMKHFYKEDFAITSQDLAHLNTLELRSQAENWKGSFCGEWVDHQSFVRGRDQMIEYSQDIQRLMQDDCSTNAYMVEDRKGLKRGRVVLRLTRGKPSLSGDVSNLVPKSFKPNFSDSGRKSLLNEQENLNTKVK